MHEEIPQGAEFIVCLPSAVCKQIEGGSGACGCLIKGFYGFDLALRWFFIDPQKMVSQQCFRLR